MQALLGSRVLRLAIATLLSVTSSAWSLAAPLADNDAEEVPARLFIRAERIHVRPGVVLEGAAIFIEDGRIRAVGKDLTPPEGVQEIRGAVVCAGFIDPWSNFGVVPGAREDSRSSAATRTVDALDPTVDTRLVEELLRAGITTQRAQLGATSRNSGIGALVRNSPFHLPPSEKALIFEDCCVAMAVGVTRGNRGVDLFDRVNELERAVSEIADGESYREQQLKFERELAEWEEAIVEKEEELEGDFKKAKKAREKKEAEADEKGKEYKPKKYKEDRRPKEPKYNADKEVMARVAGGELPLIVEAHRAAELRALLEATKRFERLRLIVAGGTEALTVADELAERNVPVLVWPRAFGVDVPDELDGSDLGLAGQLAERGVTVLLGSGGRDPDVTRDLPLLAARAVAHGLSREDAFEALTLGAARALDADRRIGTVEFGKDADLLVLDGEPLTTTARVQYVIVGGEVAVSPEGN